MPQSIWAVVPAAGAGRRMGAEVPKQYLKLGERCVLEHTIARLRGHRAVRGVLVVLAADDEHFAQLPAAGQVERVVGGAERADSVLNALQHLCASGRNDDWAMVHDAVRPCVHPLDLDRLAEHARAGACGAILAAPVRDTMKRAAEQRIVATVARDDLWHALTPQLFPIRALRDALLAARAAGISVTDEAQAMELAGQAPVLVTGRADNIKITRAEDLELAAFFLTRLQA